MAHPLPALVADIGGTNVRFALARQEPDGRIALDEVRVLTVAEHPTLADAVRAYLAELGAGEAPQTAVYAVACPTQSDTIKFTNNPWTFSITALREELKLPHLRFINDFAALSMSLPQLDASDLEFIGPVPPPTAGADRSYAVIGPGTGLGVGGLLVRDGRPIVIESEGGHIGFAPADDYEIELLRVLLREFDRVSYERLISGGGLLRLYRAMCAIEAVAPVADTPAAVTTAAGAEPDGLCARAVLRFCAILGAAAGDVALAFGAWNGVYLGGGISHKLLEWLHRSEFRARFETKGRHSALMAAIPTMVIRHPQAGLLGAAAYALSDSVGHAVGGRKISRTNR